MLEYEEMLAKKGAIIIYCSSDPQIAYRRAIKRGESYVTNFETYEKISNAYNDLFRAHSHKIPVVEFSF